jgi:hypothetical protein
MMRVISIEEIKERAERFKEQLWQFLETAPGYDSEHESIKDHMNDILDSLDEIANPHGVAK